MLMFRKDGDGCGPSRMKLLVVGRSGCGKDALRRELEHRGLSFVKSYTTRAKRSQEEDTHVFVSRDEAKRLMSSSDVVAMTEIDGNLYFTLAGQLEDADAYIVDPRGVSMLAETLPDVPLFVVYVSADEDVRRTAAIARADDAQDAADTFDARSDDEREQFDSFEGMLAALDSGEDGIAGVPASMVIAERYVNDFVPSTLGVLADRIASVMLYYENLAEIIGIAVDRGMVDVENTNVTVKQMPYAVDASDAELARFVRNMLSERRIRDYAGGTGEK